ncbi:MAG: hypothetical protein FWC36_02850 [Spirochaetes bacterium]|nr:hypothetical protein [Spirochaetota bacterium]
MRKKDKIMKEAIVLLKKALAGDLDAIEFILETIGEKPKSKNRVTYAGKGNRYP